MYIITVATRYLLRRPMSYVATAIVVLIVVLYLLIISVMEGFKVQYMSQIQSIYAHMNVRVGNDPGGILYPEKWSDEVAKIQGVKGVTIGLEIPAIMIANSGRTVGTLRGVDLDRELAHGRLKEFLKPADLTEFGTHKVGNKNLQGCVIGGLWAREFNLKLGDHLTFLFTDDQDDPRAIAFVIVGIFESQNEFLEGAAYIDRRFLAKQLNLPDYAKTLSVWVEGDPDRPDLDQIRVVIDEKMRMMFKRDVAWDAKLAAMLEDRLRIETWREKNANLYDAISRENNIMRFIMSIYLIFVVIIVMLILGRLVAEKTRDIGILRAMGATTRGVSVCFLLQGVIISLWGLLVGLPLALLLIGNVNEAERGLHKLFGVFGFDFRVFPSQSFLVKEIPTHVLPSDLVLISALVVLVGLLGGLLPAWRVTRLNPVECLRQE